MRFPKLLALGAMLVCWARPRPGRQHLSAGVIGGVPLTDLVSTAASVDPSHPFAFFANTKRYIVGVSGEVRLPFGLGIEMDALYRHLNYTGSGSTIGVTAVNTASSTTGNAWEFPLVAKYHFPSKVIRPYVEGGVAWDSLQGLTQTIRNTVLATGLITSSSTSNPARAEQEHGLRLRHRGWRGRARTGHPHHAGDPLHALGREALPRPQRAAQQQPEPGRVPGGIHLLTAAAVKLRAAVRTSAQSEPRGTALSRRF